MKKKLYFKSNSLTPGIVGAAIAGSNQKMDLLAFCKKVNSHPLCDEFPEMKLKLEIIIKNKQVNYKVSLITRELLKYFEKNNLLSESDLEKIAKYKENDFNTSNYLSIKKTILAYAKNINITLESKNE